VLVKVIEIKDGEAAKAQEYKIQWKEGKNYTVKIIKKKKKNKKVTK
jgi:hypothetical protein